MDAVDKIEIISACSVNIDLNGWLLSWVLDVVEHIS